MTEVDVRPDIHSLERHPTLNLVSEVWGTLELKLDTGDTRYWVTTRGLARQSQEAPINYVQGYVTIEKRNASGSWDLSAVYSPESWKLSQAFDYCRMLQRKLNDLQKQVAEKHSWTLMDQIDELTREIKQVKRVILKLSALVRSTLTDQPEALV